MHKLITLVALACVASVSNAQNAPLVDCSGFSDTLSKLAQARDKGTPLATVQRFLMRQDIDAATKTALMNSAGEIYNSQAWGDMPPELIGAHSAEICEQVTGQ